VSQADVDFLRSGIARLQGATDLEAIAEVFHPEVEVRDISHLPDMPELLRGREQVVAMFEKWMEDLDDWSVEYSDWVDADPWVVCKAHWRAIGKGSGAPVEWVIADAYQVKDSQIVRAVWGYPDVEAALADLGPTTNA
jgi:ketosteroid isomerase-like protein